MRRSMGTIAIVTALATHPACMTALTAGGRKVTGTGLGVGAGADLVLGFAISEQATDSNYSSLLIVPLTLMVDVGLMALLSG